MPYHYASGASGLTSFPARLTTLITVPKLVIQVRNLTPRGDEWERAGYLQAVSLTNIGEVYGESKLIIFGGKREIELKVPAYPYQLEFIPKHWVTNWELEFWTKDRSGSDGTPSVPLTEALSTDIGWVIW